MAKRGPEPTPLAVRFWRFVEKHGPDECWPWTGALDRHGYGQIRRGGRSRRVVQAHRVGYELTFGPIPRGPGYHGTSVCHSCDNRRCCNPAHWFLGTHAVNMADRCAKARARRKPQAQPVGPDLFGREQTAKLVKPQDVEW